MMNNYLKNRHIGISEAEQAEMLQTVGVQSLYELIEQTIPADIRLKEKIELPAPFTERAYAEHITALAAQNQIFTSYIGRGWYDTILPAVIQRNIFENPAWYTSYTPYQAEISQGRLEALLNFQTAVSDFTGLPLANASLLDEASAAAEAMTMMYNLRSREQQKAGVNVLFVDENIFPQSLAVIKTRAKGQGIEVEVGKYYSGQWSVVSGQCFGVILQYPNADGNIEDYRDFVEKAHSAGCKVAVAADILALALLVPPGEWGADICFGSTQRWGIPMFYGGPSAAYFATREEFKRDMPGRIIGISRDANGRPALRMALQTREQHIKREKATSNICTAQALLATMAGMYCVYHGADSIRRIAERIHSYATYVSEILAVYGFTNVNDNFFDTLKVVLPENISVERFRDIAEEYEVNFYYYETGEIGISFDETTDIDDINTLIDIFAETAGNTAVYYQEQGAKNNEQRQATRHCGLDLQSPENENNGFPLLKSFDESFERKSNFLTHEVFKKYHSETEMMRYIKKLERRDMSLTHSMISLGSCTMKLNAASEMLPLSNPQFANIHPLAPRAQTEGYNTLIAELETYLCEITGFAACSLQPNSGAAGEFTGLLTIKSYFESKGETARNTILIPESAHGTNPASAAQAGLNIVVVKCDGGGNVDIADWEAKAAENRKNLLGCMITYPSTHGIFEQKIKKMCEIVHQNGGLVYMDGANMNAQVGLTNPATIGADVCHLNLHKTFAIPHGGGGPGVGPICVTKSLMAFLPQDIFEFKIQNSKFNSGNA
ncbi:MAG: aminomethyl-transferring glycine dehydrogenase, partial [Paludibacter sp.]|nr:aminomethyl-transferring glycine dehydrogenase [Paludibacter sp.]